MAKQIERGKRQQCALAAAVALVATFLPPAAGAHAQSCPDKPSIEDFVAAQGTACIPDGMGGCFMVIPGIENFLGFSDPEAMIAVSVDYAGLANEYIESQDPSAALGTTFTGNVVQHRLPDGRYVVKVLLHTRDALTFAVQGFVEDDETVYDFVEGPVIYGTRASDVLDGATPTLSDSLLQVVYITPDPCDFPDLIELLAPDLVEDPGPFEIVRIAFRAHSVRFLDARLSVVQAARVFPKGSGLENLLYSVEKVIIRDIGPNRSSRRP